MSRRQLTSASDLNDTSKSLAQREYEASENRMKSKRDKNMVNVEMADIALSKEAKDTTPKKVKKSRKERRLEKKQQNEKKEQTEENIRNDNRKRSGILKPRSDTAQFSKTYNLALLDSKSGQLMRAGTANNEIDEVDPSDGSIFVQN